MTTNLKFANWAKSSLATNFPIASTSLVLKTGDGSKFPATGDFYLVLSGGVNQTSNEIVKATARSGDTLTVVRAQDGTVAQDFYANDSVSLTIVRALLSDQTVNTSDTPAFKGLQLNTDPQFADHVEGRIYWDNQDKTAVVDMSTSGVKLQLGQENFIRVKNVTGATISNGQVVYINGSSSNRPTIALAQANSYVTSKTVIGVATHNITNGSEGYITTSGLVRDFNTSGFTDGDILYLSQSSPGSLTNVAPVAPNFNVVIGYCEKSHATLGTILVQVQNNSFVQNYFEPTITILPVARGGTGASSAALAGANILGIGVPSTGKYLTNDGTNYVWADISGGVGVQSIGINNTNGGLVITNSPITSTGTITVNLKDDLLSLENLSTIGYAQRIGTSLWQTVAQVPIGDINGTGTLQITNNSDTTPALTITQTGTANAFVVEDQATDSTPFVINSFGQVIVGHSASAPTGASWPAQIIGTGGSNGIGITQFSADANGGSLSFTKSRNAIGAWGTAAASGDNIGVIMFYMDKGDGVARGANIYSQVDGTPSVTSTPGRLSFGTTPDGATIPVERLRIGSTGTVGLGGANAVNYGVWNRIPMTGNTSANGFRSDGVVQSDVTVGAIYYQTVASTAATTFSLNTLKHFSAVQGTLGAGSSVTTQYGFIAESSLTGATNNHGFFGNIAAGTGRWNFYAAGTADNYFAGNVLVGTAGKVAIGHNTTLLGAGFTPSLQTVGGTNGDENTLGRFRFSANTGGLLYDTYKSRNASIGSHTIVNSGDTLAQFRFFGSDGSSFAQAADISVIVDGTPGAGDMPGRLVFSTTPDGSNVPLERMRITADGRVGIGATPGASTSLTVSKNITGATTAAGIYNTPVIQSDVTGTSHGIREQSGTAAAAFTLGSLHHYTASQGTFGAGSSVTSQSGYHADSSLTGATTNYGFLSNIVAGTGRYNFFAGGSADNYFAGNTTFGNNAGININLKAGAAGTNGAINWTFSSDSTVYSSISLPYDTRTSVGLKIESGASYPITLNSGNGIIFQEDGVTHSALSSSKIWYLGNDSIPTGFTGGGLNLIGKDTFFHFTMSRVTDDINSAAMYFNKARGTFASPTSPTLNDGIGSIFFQVYNAASGTTQQAASILAIVDGEVGTALDTSDAPGALSFRTSAEGSSTPTERLKIDSTGASVFSGTVSHAGLVMSSGTSVDQVYTFTTASLSLSATWVDAGLAGSTLGAMGTYIVQITTSVGIEFYSGVISWLAGTNGNAARTQEIPLTRATNGTAADVFLRIVEANATNPKFQLSASGSRAAATYTLKFRRVI